MRKRLRASQATNIFTLADLEGNWKNFIDIPPSGKMGYALCLTLAQTYQRWSWARGYYAGKRQAILAEAWYYCAEIARKQGFVIKREWEMRIEEITPPENTLWDAPDFESIEEEIDPRSYVTAGYCLRRAQAYESEAYAEVRLSDYYAHQACIWYAMHREALKQGQDIPSHYTTYFRDLVKGERWLSPFHTLKREDGLPDCKSELGNPSPTIKVWQEKTQELPASDIATPLGTVHVYCNEHGQVNYRMTEPVTIYTVEYRISGEFRPYGGNGKPTLHDYSRRTDSHEYPSAAARKRIQDAILPAIVAWESANPNCQQAATQRGLQNSIYRARDEIAQIMEQLRVHSKWLDIIQSELSEHGFINEDDAKHLRRFSDLRLERRGSA